MNKEHRQRIRLHGIMHRLTYWSTVPVYCLINQLAEGLYGLIMVPFLILVSTPLSVSNTYVTSVVISISSGYIEMGIWYQAGWVRPYLYHILHMVLKRLKLVFPQLLSKLLPG